MNMINDGGPAFPVWELNGKDQPEMTGFGMTLRDYFAARAMQSLLVTIDTYPDEHWRDGLAMDAYMMANAMLRAREVENEAQIQTSNDANSLRLGGNVRGQTP